MINEREEFDLMIDITRRMAAFALAIACDKDSDKITSIFDEIESGIIESGYFGFGDKNELIGTFVAQYKQTAVNVSQKLSGYGEIE